MSCCERSIVVIGRWGRAASRNLDQFTENVTIPIVGRFARVA
jgi:hypothetical protein